MLTLLISYWYIHTIVLMVKYPRKLASILWVEQSKEIWPLKYMKEERSETEKEI